MQNITLKGNSYGILLDYNSDVRYLNLQNVTLNGNSYGIYTHSSSNISIDDCVMTNGYTAISLYGFSQTLSVRNSEIYDHGGSGIESYYYYGSVNSLNIQLESCILGRNSYVINLQGYYYNYGLRAAVILRRCILVENSRIFYSYSYYYNIKPQFSLEINECNISRTKYPGFELHLEQSNINLTFYNNTFVGNSHTVLRMWKNSVDTTRSSILIDKNIFVNNSLSPDNALIDFSGKGIGTLFIDINENTFMKNKCSFMIKVHIQSNRAAGFFSFKNNILEDNEGVASNSPKNVVTGVRSYSVGLLGCISNRYNIQHNVFDNELMEKELFIGRTCGSNYISENFDIDATFNYWGTSSTVNLHERLFHFPNWNDRPRVKYLPAAAARNFTGVITSRVFTNQSQIGGYVSSSLRLTTKYSPYVVMNDLTISENVTLTIEPGVQLYLKPNIGLLVFGNIIAHGTMNEEIKFCSLESKCKLQRTISIRLVGGDRERRGKLEIRVGGRWLGACRYHFTSRDGSVACRQLSYGRYVNHESRYFGRNSPYKVSFNCRGNETSLSNCKNQTVYYCGSEYYGVYLECERDFRWGNIRIALPKGVNSSDYYHKHEQSSLGNIFIHSAGYLHDQGVSAIQIIERSPSITHLHIIESNGIELIGQKQMMTLEHINIENSLQFPAIVILGNKGSISISRSSIKGGNKHGVTIAPIKNMTFFQPYIGQHDLCDPQQKIYVGGQSYVFLNQRSEIRDILCGLEILSPNNTIIHFRLLSWVESSYSIKINHGGHPSFVRNIYDWNTHQYLDKVTVIPSNSMVIEAQISTLSGFLAEITVIGETGKDISFD